MSSIENPEIKTMFDSIANRYDFLNRTLSLMFDKHWRKIFVKGIVKDNPQEILDIACGTGDVIIAILKEKILKEKEVKIIGLDFSLKMLEMAKKKLKNIKNVKLIYGDCLYLPFNKNTFDAISIAFGIRNINDKTSALKECYRVLNKKSKIHILELTTPTNKILHFIYFFYFKKLLPFFGGIVSKNFSAYSYLPNSVLNFPTSKKFALIMEEAGFKNIKFSTLTFGIVTIYQGEKF